MIENDYLSVYPEETRSLIAEYLEGIASEHDRMARERIFWDFHRITGKDLLHAETSAFEAYVGELRNRVAAGRMKLNTALKFQRVIAAFAAFVMKEKKKGNPNVPSGFEDRTLTARIEEPPEEIHFKDIPSLKEMDDIIGYLRSRKDFQTLAAILLAYKCLFKTGEITELKKSDILSDGEGYTYITIKSEQPVRISEDVASILDTCLAETPDGGYIFSRNGSKITQAALQKRIRCACINAGIGSYSLNSFRNAGVSAAIGAGADSVRLCDDMRYRNRAHIKRLSSLPIHYTDMRGYVNIEIKDPPNR